ncbi:MAG TPA: type I-E CRISPR-associated protein Cas6/Cse3/CasE, partial [Terriglobia bacterium]|nr:type I-E CRISPR-associated protein Cas6/Cse3/CasE [Terriglobia bacterium]
MSCLLIDVGSNPDRPRPGRLWLRNLYHVHQRLCMAFPSKDRISHDAHFLKPFKPEDFAEQVHVGRKVEAGFLFRIDPQPIGRAMLVVQSAAEPNWDYAFHNAPYLLAAPPEKKQFEPSFTTGQRLRFRLLANPTKRLSKRSLGADGKPLEKWANKEGKGKRVPVPTHQLIEWLADWRVRVEGKDEPPGFCIIKDSATVQAGYVYVNKGRDGNGHRLRSAR